MLYSITTAADKRAAFRDRLAGGELLRFPRAFNPLSARLIEEKGWEASTSPAPCCPPTWACPTSD